MDIISPPYRAFGSKFQIRKWILSQFPRPHLYDCYVESFGQTGSVLLAKSRTEIEVFNDLEQEVVNIFMVLRDEKMSERLCDMVELTPYSKDEFLRCYEPTDDPVEWARRAIFRSFAGYGAGGLSGRKTGFKRRLKNTSPAGSWARYPRKIAIYTKRLQGVIIENEDALTLIPRYDSPRCLHYIDPPYLGSSRAGSLSSVYAHEMMTPEQHIALSEVLHKCKGYVVLSGYNSPLYDDLYQGWTKVTKKTRDMLAVEREEVLWLSPNVPVQKQMSLLDF